MNPQDKSAVELKPCPFCGGSAGVMKAHGVFQVCCADSGCPANGTYKTREEAAIVWNARAEPAVQRAGDVEEIINLIRGFYRNEGGFRQYIDEAQIVAALRNFLKPFNGGGAV